MRLLATCRLSSLCPLDWFAQEGLDSAERIYNLFADELSQSGREILAIALLDTRYRLIGKL